MLKRNSTLTKLNFLGSNKEKKKKKKKKSKICWKKCNTGNKIGVEGARSLSEALKTNTTLTSLDLMGENYAEFIDIK